MITEFTLIANNQNNELVIAHTHAFLITAAGAQQLFIIHHSLFIRATPPLALEVYYFFEHCVRSGDYS